MNKLILFKSNKLMLVEESDGLFRLPFEGEVELRLPDALSSAEESAAEVFRFPGYIAMSSDLLLSDALLPDADGKPGPKALREVGLRESWTLLPENDYAAAAKGVELLNWSDATRFCSRCGALLRRATEISKKCPDCGREIFPSLWPAIVVLVTRPVSGSEGGGEEALLVHARTLSRPTVQTLVAGFVETGESLEECVAREVREETSLEIDDIRYVGSQSWPFPHQLMLGFTARYKSGEVRFADGELTAGGFFRPDALPDLPTLPSLSRRIIDRWATKQNGRY